MREAGACGILSTFAARTRLLVLAAVAILATPGAAAGRVAASSPTKTELRLATSSVTEGAENAERFAVTVTAEFGAPSGTVQVESQSGTLCSATLDAAASMVCLLTSSQLAPGAYSVWAVFPGAPGLEGSTSPVQTLHVKPVPTVATTTRLTLSATSATVGAEDGDTFSVSVTAASGTPSGSMRVVAGAATLCGAALDATGSATCSLAPSQLPVGKYSVAAVYAGASGFKASRSAQKTLHVTGAATSTQLSLSSSSVTSGAENETFQVRVTAASGTPSGTVQIQRGAATLCAATLDANGDAACSLTPSQLPVGAYSVWAVYSGAPGFNVSSSPSQTLHVTP